MLKTNGVSALKIAGVYIGTIVGAGFATGQEILQFFARFGLSGLWGIILTTALFILFGYIVMELGYKLFAQSHLEIIRYSGGRVIGSIMDIMITFFLFGSMTAMIAGTGALFAQQFGLPAFWGSLLMAVITTITVLTGINGVINSISIVVPFLLASVIGISIFTIIKSPPLMSAAQTIEKNIFMSNWWLATVLYISYNIVLSIGVLGPLGAHAKDERAIFKGAALGGLGLGLGTLMIYLAICGNIINIQNMEVPMSYIAGNISHLVQLIYAVILVAEIYTTAVGSLYSFSARTVNLERSPRKGKAIVAGVATMAFFASLLGFSNLVKYLYPSVGYLGIIMLICLIYTKIKNRGRY